MSRDEDAGDAKAPTASCEPDVPKAVLQAQLRAIRDVWTSESVRSNDRHADAGRLSTARERSWAAAGARSWLRRARRLRRLSRPMQDFPHAPNVLPIIREVQRAGAKTLRAIAEALNARGVPTARGGRWTRP